MRAFIRLIVLLIFFSTLSEFGFAAINMGNTQTNVTCYGGNDGTISLSPTGGVAPYTYFWNDGNVNQNRTNLPAGTYDVTVTDNTGATVAMAIALTQAPRFIVGVATTGENCGGQSIGTISLTVSGATPGYTYLWNDGITTQNRTGLLAAVYYVTITDSKQCTTVDSGNITQPPGIGITPNISLATCGANNGAISLTVQYGTPAYSFLWNDGSNLQNRTGLAIGTYRVTVTDAIGCSQTATEILGSLPGSLVINSSVTEPVCNGGNNASISITSVVGSTGPYTYLWNNGNGTSNPTGLIAGSYSVTVTSGTGCTSSSTVNVAEPAPINIQLNAVPLTCFGSNNGAINTTVSGGVFPYTYNWSGGIHLRNLMMLQSLTYRITVTDAVGCTATASTFVPEPLQLNAVAVPSPLACAGGATGSVLTTVTGGTPAYTYWWGAGITSPDRINVNSGNYFVTVTDGNGCTAAASAIIPGYTPLALSTSPVNNVCFGGSSGQIDLTVTDGLAPYLFAWSTITGAQNISSLADGIYTVTVTDGHLCTATMATAVTGPPFPISVNSTIDDALCNGGSNGSISVNPTDGTAPYTYNWGAGITSQTRTNLVAGNYFITVTDNFGCTATSSFTVNQPTPLDVISAETNVTCFAGSDGAVILNVSGSFAPYSYHWNDGAAVQNRINIIAGNYAVTVTDNHLCTATANMVITQPSQIIINPAVVNLTCNGVNTGSINLTVNGGTGGYTYNWGAVTTPGRTNLAAGTYDVTVTDNSNCSVSSSMVLTQPTAVVEGFTVTNVSCNGGANGGIISNTVGGISPYTYNWGGGITTTDRTNLIAGSYPVTVTDFNGCTVTNTAAITEPAILNVVVAVSNVSCNGGNNGAVILTVTGGTIPYTFNWTGGINTQNRANLAAGTYAVTVTDHNGCIATGSSTVIQPAALTVAAVKTDVLCNAGNNGGINLTVNGGVFPYSYNWGGGITTMNRTNLAAGSYTVTVTDHSGCTGVNTSTIIQPTPLLIAASETEVLCNGGNNGAVNITVTGSTSPYTYDWGGGITTQNRTNIPAGNYSVTVADFNHCTATGSFAVTEPSTLALSLTPVNAACFGQASGAVNLSVTGGTAGYTYLWNNSVRSQNQASVIAGGYSVTVTDAHLCTSSSSANVTAPAQLNVAVASIGNASCFHAINGDINITVTGGTLTYSYLWSNHSTNQNITGIGTGAYAVTVTDANLCTATVSANVTQPAAIAIVTNPVEVSCFGGNNGQISTRVTGGTGGYTYLWSNTATTPNVGNLITGTYIVTVTDASACTASVSVGITQPAAIAIITIPVNISCSGANNGSVNLTVSGGTGAYSYAWSNSVITRQINNLAPNSYSVTVTDANSCTATQSAVITAPPATTLASSHTDYACAAHEGTIQLTPGGTAPFSYNWGGGVTAQNRTNLLAGNYSVTLTDGNLCTAATTVAIAAIPALVPALAPTNVSCFAGNNGAINLTVTGGTAPFIYRWSNNASSPNISNLVAASYGIVVTDANNCTAATTAFVTQPAQIHITPSVTAVHCAGLSDGIIDVTVNGGTPGYTYKWNNNSTTQNITGLGAGVYDLTVTDADLCTAVLINITVSQPAPVVLTSTILAVGCAGQTDGGIQLNVNGGAAPYNFSWSNGMASQNLNGVAMGSYTVTVSDQHGCSTHQSYTVGSAPALWMTGDVHNVTCNDMKNGSLALNAGGGTPGYSYAWSADTAFDLEHLAAGVYVVTISDALGCSARFSFDVATDYHLEIQAGPSTTIKVGQFALLSVSANVDHGNEYTWAPSASLSCSTCLTTEASPRQNTSYTVYASDTNGCKVSAEVTVEVNSTFNIFVPNAFTPNGDGNNDEFQIFGDINSVNYLQMAVFNRWGEKVFESGDSNFKWDGSYKGEPAPQGVYIYAMQTVFSDGSRRDFKGSVSLLR